METKKCECCGLEKHLSHFTSYGLKDGSIRYSNKCQKCYNDERSVRAKWQRIANMVMKADSTILIAELVKRGYNVEKS